MHLILPHITRPKLQICSFFVNPFLYTYIAAVAFLLYSLTSLSALEYLVFGFSLVISWLVFHVFLIALIAAWKDHPENFKVSPRFSYSQSRPKFRPQLSKNTSINMCEDFCAKKYIENFWNCCQ